MANQYFTCELEAWREGTTLYGRMHYYRSGTYHYQDTSFPDPTINLGGTVYTDTGFGNWVRSGIDVGDVRTTTYSRTVQGTGTRNVTFSAGSGLRSDFAGTWSKDVYDFPGVYTDPSISSVTVNSKTHNSANMTITGSYGRGTGSYQIEVGIGAQSTWTSPSLRSVCVKDGRTSYTATVNNSSPQTTTLTLVGNTKYWYGGYIYNGHSSDGRMFGNIYLPCPPLSALSLSSQSYTAYNRVNAVISYTRQTDGGAETRTGYYRYSTDGGNTYTGWTSFGTVSNTTGTFTVSLPTASSVTLQARLNTPNGGASESKTVTFSTSATHTAPNFSNFTYEDISSAALALTNNNQIFIQGQSQPKVTISTANKATANDGATITGYTASLNAQSIQIAYSSSAAVSGTFSANTPTAYGTLALSVAANDSLSLATSVSKNVTVIPWAAPVVQATAVRVNNFEAQTTLSISGSYSPVSVNGTVKNTLAVAYRYKKTTDSTWGDWTNRPVTITDSTYQAIDLVLSFDNEKQWDIEVRAVDAFTTTTLAITLNVGKPIFFISENGKCSINRKPTNQAADFDVEGLIYAQDEPVMASHVGMIIFSKSLTTAADVRALYGGYWTSDSSFSASGVYCWRRTS